MSAGQSFEFVEGATGDLAFVAHGETPGEAFAAAGEAFLAATVEEPATVERREQRSVEFDEPDLDLLLLRFLNELVYLRDAEDLLLHPEHVEVAAGPVLMAVLAGERIDRARHALAADVKAATAHGLSVEKTEHGWTATATLDV
ncbi:MAG: archease [Deltaproteobacteria bacterium]|nr:archease [Deltaproteobacteria bacterium]MBW2416061.1 archease [Deltaproteobacteria bacterium]